MRVLVTGGAGFIGSHLCEALLKRGDVVVCFDNLQTGSQQNIAHLQSNERFTFAEGDIAEPLPDLGGRFDTIFNLACPASPAAYQIDEWKTLRTCTLGLFNITARAKQDGAKLLQASTSEIYGEPLEHPQREDYRGNVSTLGPRACYDEGKRVAEAIVTTARRQHGVDTKLVRIFNTYGPRMDRADGRVVSNFIVQALKNEPITLYGDGSQTRSFCYVADLVQGLLAMAASAPEISGPMNLGNPSEITVRQLAERIKALTSSSSEIIFKPLPVDDPTRRCPDINKAKTDLNWHPTTNLDNGLQQTIEYYRQ